MRSSPFVCFFSLTTLAALSACDFTDPGVDLPDGEISYEVHGRVLSLGGGDVPAADLLDLTLRSTWADLDDPFPVNAPVVDRLALAGDRTYSAEVVERDGGGVAALYLDDADGELLRGITDHRVEDGATYELNAVALARSTLAVWAADPRLAGRDLESEGLMVLLYVGPDGRPLAGVVPDPGTCEVEFVMLSDDLADVIPETRVTGRSGAALAAGAPAFFYGYRSADVDGRYNYQALVGAAAAPGAVFVETITIDDPEAAIEAGQLPAPQCPGAPVQ